MKRDRPVRRWIVLAVLLASVCRAAPASACPDCCAPVGGSSGLVCAMAAECEGCDPVVRPARPSDRTARLDDLVGATALPSTAGFLLAPPSAARDLLPHPSAPARGRLPVTSPLRL
jgi:hypothetical protein